MFHPDTRCLIDCWTALAREPSVRGGLPRRSDFAPERLGEALARAFLLTNSEPAAVVRLCGSWLEAEHGRPLAGSRFLDLWCESSAALVVPALARAVREARPVVVIGHLGDPMAPAEVVFAPLRGADDRADTLLGLLATAGRPDTTPGGRLLSARVTVGAGQQGRPALTVIDRRSA